MSKIDNNKPRKSNGFTLIEILVVIGIIAVLAGVILVAINPSRQFKLARDLQRSTNLDAILNAIHQNMSEHKGVFVCDGEVKDIPTVTTMISTDTGTFDVAECLAPDYIAKLPIDPTRGSYLGPDDYDTFYYISTDSDGRLLATAQGELTATISATR